MPPQPTPFTIPLPQPSLSVHTNSPPQSRIPLDSLPFKLSQFSGDPQENPSRFVKDFRLAATISSWPRELWSTAFQLCLKGAARTWFERLSPIILQDPDHIFAEFLRKYRPSGIDWAAESLFSNSIQAPYETVKQFANRSRTTELGGRTGKSERDILHQFIKGLSPPCRTHTLTQGPTTLEEAINKATLYESAMKFSQPSSLQHMTEGQGDRPKASQGHKRLWCTFCGKQGHLLKNCRAKNRKSSNTTNEDRRNRQQQQTFQGQYRNNRSVRSDIVCFKCGKTGHIQRNCALSTDTVNNSFQTKTKETLFNSPRNSTTTQNLN